MLLKKSRLALSGFVLAIALGASHAYAADAKQVADTIVALATVDGKAQASYDNATASGDDVTITNLKVTGDGDTVTIPSMVLTGVQPRDKGGYSVQSVTLDGGSMTTADKGDVSWQTASGEGLTIPSLDEAKAKVHITPFSNFKLAGLVVKGGELAVPVELQEINGKVAVDEKGSPTDFTSNLIGLKLPLELISDEQQRAVITSLGYTEPFVINMTIDGGYQTAGDNLNIRSFQLDAVNVGKLGIGGKFSGLPLSKLSDPEKAKEIAATAKLDNFSIRFDNAGIVEKVLDMQAKQSGMSKADFVTQITGALPFMLNFIGNEPFQKKVADAVTAFLNEPKSITISASPSAPVEFVKIMGAGQSAPQTLPDLLGADISANN